MPKIFTPANQLRLTNVAVVRLKKGGKRFEIACHKSKVIEWRNNIEKDIDDVLQIHTVFINVSKGQAAKKDELINAFGNCDETRICKEILTKGELQVSEKERQSATDAQLKEFIQQITSICIDPETGNAISASSIENSLREAGFKLKAGQKNKEQIMEAIQLLRDNKFALQRARMKIVISYKSKEASAQLRDSIAKLTKNVEKEHWDNNTLNLRLQIDAGNFDALQKLVRNETRNKGSIQKLEVQNVDDSEDI